MPLSVSLDPEMHAPRRRWATMGVPGLVSTCVHLAVVVGLALPLGRSVGAARQEAPTDGMGIGAVIVNTEGSAGGDGAGGFYDDDPQATKTMLGGGPISAGSGGGADNVLSGALAAKPDIDLGAVLPARAGSAASGALEAGVGGALQATSGSRGSGNLRGGYARTGVFGAMAQGYKFVYVFDRSGSMDGHGGAPLAAAKSQLLASLNDLGQTHQFQIIFYNEHPHIFNLSGSPGRLVFGNEQNKKLAARFVAGVTADGATQHEEALDLALRLQPDAIFFLTDADEPRLTGAQLARIARKNQGASINTIEFGYGVQLDRDNFLVRLAEQNGGKHVYVDVSQLARVR